MLDSFVDPLDVGAPTELCSHGQNRGGSGGDRQGKGVLGISVLRQAGRNPTQSGVAAILETRGSWTDPEIGGLPIEFSRTDHLGGHSGLVAQVRGGRWVLLADNLVSVLP